MTERPTDQPTIRQTVGQTGSVIFETVLAEFRRRSQNKRKIGDGARVGKRSEPKPKLKPESIIVPA